MKVVPSPLRAALRLHRERQDAKTAGPLRNDRQSCVCGAARRNIPSHMWRVSDKEDDPFFPKYYYRCPVCLSFSAPQIYFPTDKYETLALEFYGKGEQTDLITDVRVRSMLRELAGDPCGAVLLDLGSGGGWLSRRFVSDVPGSRALAVDADPRLHDPYYQDDSSIEFVPERIDDFLHRFGGETSRGERAGADAAIMTDVLEHLLWPEATVQLVLRALRPGGVGYFVVPNSWTFQVPKPFPVAAAAVDWAHAKHTCQHIWTMSPEAFERIFVRAGFSVLRHDQALETDIRRDAVYSTVVVRR
jgi:SAM-dependent methyltransferase